LIHDYIKFGQLSVKEYVNYKQCLNSLRTALVVYTVFNSHNFSSQRPIRNYVTKQAQ